MLLVATPWVALFLEPAARHSNASAFAEAVDFAYPIGDAILVGATLGVMALMGWRPGRMWIVLGAGFVALAIADAIYSVDALGHSYSEKTTFDAVWLVGIALIAYASWLPHPGQLEPVTVTGWQAIALPVSAQLLAIGLPGLRALLRRAAERADLHHRRVAHCDRADRRDAPAAADAAVTEPG